VQTRIRAERQELEQIGRSIGHFSSRIVTHKKALLGACAARLNALSPLATLSRGYAVARDKDGRALTSARQFSKGLKFDLLLHDGEVAARADEVSPTDRQQ